MSNFDNILENGSLVKGNQVSEKLLSMSFTISAQSSILPSWVWYLIEKMLQKQQNVETKISAMWPWYQNEKCSVGTFLQVTTKYQTFRLIFHHNISILSTLYLRFITNKSVLSAFYGSITFFTLHEKLYIRLVLWKEIKFWGPLGAIFLLKFLFGNRYFQLWLVDVANSHFSVPPQKCIFYDQFWFWKGTKRTFQKKFLGLFLTKSPISKEYFWQKWCSLMGIDSHKWTFQWTLM